MIGLISAAVGLAVELQRPVQIAVIGQRQRVHPVVRRALDQPVDRTGTVQQAVVAVAMQMTKRLAAHKSHDPS